jgi:SNF2 family DNA or RNA helicase
MLIPRPYQLDAIHTIVRKNILLGDECGLGKTLQAIEAIKILQTKINRPALIVIPKSLRSQWVNALIAQGVEPVRIVPVENALNIQENAIIVTHYEAVVKYREILQGVYWSIIVADEAHRIKNRKAKRTEALKALHAYRKLAMTGTPLDLNPADSWSIYNWLAPEFFKSYWKFFEAHVNYESRLIGKGQMIKQIIKAQPLRDPKRFAIVLRPYTIRRLKSDVREDIPARIDQVVSIQLNPDQMELYKKLVNSSDVLVEVAQGVEVSMPIVLTEILRLVQCTSDPALLGAKESSAKIAWVKDWVLDNPNEPVIIFTRFRQLAIKIAQELEALEGFDQPVKLIIGGSDRSDVTQATRCIVGTIAAMGEGLDLPHINTAIFIDCEWSNILMQQAIDRVHRINIENVKHIFYLQAEGTIDSYVFDTVRNKQNVQDVIHLALKGVKF